MCGDPRRILVFEDPCDDCGSRMIHALHARFPEMQVEDATAEFAVELLAVRLATDLDCISDPAHRKILQDAVDDARAYLEAARNSGAATTA